VSRQVGELKVSFGLDFKKGAKVLKKGGGGGRADIFVTANSY